MAHGSTAGAPAAVEPRLREAPAEAAPPAITPQAGQHAPHAGQDPSQIDAARLRKAIAQLSRRLRRHQLAGLTQTQLSALYTVDQAGPLRLSDLAAAEGIAPSTLTRLVAVLEERGYVLRCAVAGDARASKLSITPQGHEILDRIKQESTSALAGSLALLSPEDLAALAAALPAIEHLAGGA